MWRVVKSRMDKNEEFFQRMEDQGWKLKSALYSCMDGMYHYIFRKRDDEQQR
jgi:hypothetical protein